MEEIAKTEFNSNVAVLERINSFINYAAKVSYAGDLDAWFKILENLRRATYTKMRHQKSKGKDGCIKNCLRCASEKMFNELQRKHNSFITFPKEQKDQNYFNLKNDFRKSLDEYEIFLSEYLDDKGMLLTEKEDNVGL